MDWTAANGRKNQVAWKERHPEFCSLTLSDLRPLTWRVETPLFTAVKEDGLKAPMTTTWTAVAGLTSTLSSCEAGSLRMQMNTTDLRQAPSSQGFKKKELHVRTCMQEHGYGTV